MSQAPDSRDASLPFAVQKQIDAICDRFEAAWKAGENPRLEEYLDEVPEAARAALLRGLLAVEIEYRRDADANRVPDDLILAAHPELSDDVAEALEELREPHATASHTSEAAGAPASDSIPGYTILKELNRGGQGVVYQAIQKSTHRKVALKVMLEGPFAGPDSRHRFEREVALVGSLRHPNIVPVFDSGVAQGRFFYAMEYVRGKSLEKYVESEQLSLEQTLRLFKKVCDAVNCAHQRGVIHRDLKPTNILVDSTGEPHVLDFGLAKVGGAEVDGDSRSMLLSVTGQVIGTLPYMCPEQAAGRPDEIDMRSDVYALGVILYELLTGTYPYDVKAQMADVLANILKAEPRRPSTISRQINDEVETIILKTLSKEKERRYDTAGALGRDIEHYLAGEPIDAKRDSVLYVLRKTLRRYKVHVGVAAGFVALVTAAAIAMSVMYGQQRSLSETAEMARKRAEEEARRANDAAHSEEQARKDLERQSYRDRMNLAHQALNEGNRVQLTRLLMGLLPTQNDTRPPGFELRYLWARYQQMLSLETVLKLPGTMPTTVTCIAYSGHGQYLAVACVDGTVLLYDVRDMTDVTPITLPDSIRGAEVSLSKRGKYLAAYSTPGDASAITGQNVDAVRIYEIALSQALAHAAWNATNVSSAVFTPDENELICACPDGSIEIRRLPDGKAVWTTPDILSTNGRSRIALSQDGRFLAEATIENELVLWGLAARNELSRRALAQRYVNALAFSPDSTSVWVSGAFGVRRWRIINDRLDGPYTVGNEDITSLSFSPNRDVLAMGSADYRIRLWNVNDSKWLDPLLEGDYVECVAFSPNGKYLAAGGREKVVRLWDTRFLGMESRCRSIGHYHPPLAVSCDGVVATCDRKQKNTYVLKLWKAGSPGEQIVARFDSRIEAVAFSSDGKLIAIGTKDGSVQLRNIESGGFHEMPGQRRSGVNSVAFSPDDRYIVSGGDSSDLFVWDIEIGTIRSLEGPRGHVNCLTFSSTGLLATTGGLWHDYGETFIWDLHEDKPLLEIPHPRIGRCVAFSPDGQQLAATDDFSKGEIKVYAVENGRTLLSLVGHSSKTMSLIFSRDGNRLITGSDDGTIRFWDRESGEPLGTLRVGERVRKMVLLPDGCTLITASWDGWTRVRKAVAASEIPHRQTP